MIDALAWNVKFSAKVRQLEQRYKKTGKEPKALKDRPKQDPVVDWFLNAFFVLYRSANSGGAIPLVEMKAFADMRKLILPIEEFVEIMQAMNDEVLKGRNNG